MGKLKFVFGPSGSGKTTRIYQEILERAKANPAQNFLVIVPDQFTMQTQWDLSHISPVGGVMNIDILSFGRLTHRIMTEVGTKNFTVLDDTGKCLVLQRVAGRIEEKLPLLGSKLHRQGYIHEVKSVISEFMQYGITENDIDEMIASASGKGALVAKLNDLKTIYSEFKSYLEGNYITREEKLDLLRQIMPKSAVLAGSVVVFDGFTGFTPIQIGVIEDVMSYADETIVSLVLGNEAKINEISGEHSLFYLSAKTYSCLTNIAKKNSIELLEDVYCSKHFRSEDIEHLEQNIFRSKIKKYSGKASNIRLLEMGSIPEEVHQIGLEICRLIKENETLQYRNIAVVTGDLESYAPYVQREFTKLDIPFFLDKTSGIRLNPLVEVIEAAIEIFIENFSADSVIRYLRTGLTGFEAEEIDRLELYLKETGIRGAKKWELVFSGETHDMGDKDENALAKINETRERLLKQLEPLKLSKRAKASEYIDALYDYLISLEAAKKVAEYEDYFENAQDKLRKQEYSQIYKKVMELFEQIHSLMGEDELELKEFYEILDAGIGEIRIGNIPQTVDRLMVGDIERSRVPSVKVMFFLGVNDANIPKASDKGGILSDIDRDSIKEYGKELSPTPREAMYTQRLYLYLNMTKPIDKLYISWAGLDVSGTSMRPAYICDVLKKMFPELTVEKPENREASEQLFNSAEGLRYLSDSLRKYVETGKSEELFTLYTAYEKTGNNQLGEMLKEAAFKTYNPDKIDESLSKKLFCMEAEDMVMEGSVSKLETYNSCPYKFFLQYGLRLDEVNEFEIASVDSGNIYHYVIEQFSKALAENGLTWRDFDEGFARAKVHELVGDKAKEYKVKVFQGSERNKNVLVRMEKALVYTILNVQYQIKCGSFEPTAFEDRINNELVLKNAAEGKRRKLKLVGKVDRVDISRLGDKAYIRIIDYKSSKKDLELTKIYDGQQLQLPVYMGHEIEKLKTKLGPEVSVEPAGMLYYHVNNPIVKVEKESDKEHLSDKLNSEGKMAGFVSSDMDAIYSHDDKTRYGNNSDVVPASITQNGLGKRGTNALSSEDMKTVIDYALAKSCEQAEKILDGNMPVNPLAGDSNKPLGACEYCSFKASCGFDKKIPGYSRRQPFGKMDDEAVIALMKEKLNGN